MTRFDENDDPNVVLERAKKETTALTAWFNANATLNNNDGVLACSLTYQEFLQHFVLKQREIFDPILGENCKEFYWKK